MADTKHLRHEITLMYQQGGFERAYLDLRTIHALLDCAEALKQIEPAIDWSSSVTARKALAKLEAAP